MLISIDPCRCSFLRPHCSGSSRSLTNQPNYLSLIRNLCTSFISTTSLSLLSRWLDKFCSKLCQLRGFLPCHCLSGPLLSRVVVYQLSIWNFYHYNKPIHLLLKQLFWDINHAPYNWPFKGLNAIAFSVFTKLCFIITIHFGTFHYLKKKALTNHPPNLPSLPTLSNH